MVLAFSLHLGSSILTLAATPVYAAYGKDAAFYCLYWGSFLFSLGNGTCEAVINPLTASLFPRNKTHWLNILHAGWPGGLILGALIVLGFNGLAAAGMPIRWEVQMGTFVIPVLIYGGMMFGRRFPHSEVRTAGVPFTQMLLEFVSPILLMLLLLQAMVGYVELGTDSWISNVTGTILTNKNYGLMLFVWTSGLMFVLRFFAGPIVHRISPLGLLFCAAVLGCIGLLLLGNAPADVGGVSVGAILFCILAATIYGCGKTFFWPTMLGVVSERFPKGGALTLGLVGGVGMLSAGFLGGPIIGYEQDYFAVQSIKTAADPTYDRYKTASASEPYLFLPGIQGPGQHQGRRPSEQRPVARGRHEQPEEEGRGPREGQEPGAAHGLVVRGARRQGRQGLRQGGPAPGHRGAPVRGQIGAGLDGGRAGVHGGGLFDPDYLFLDPRRLPGPGAPRTQGRGRKVHRRPRRPGGPVTPRRAARRQAAVVK